MFWLMQLGPVGMIAFAVIVLMLGLSARLWFQRWRENRLIRQNYQPNIDAEREWHAKYGKPNAKPSAPAPTPAPPPPSETPDL